MVATLASKSDAALKIHLWSKGRRYAVTLVWVTSSHFEVIAPQQLRLDAAQSTALILNDFFSLPARVVAQTEQNIVLNFTQTLHGSLLALINRAIEKSQIRLLQEHLEERATPETLIEGSRRSFDEVSSCVREGELTLAKGAFRTEECKAA
ncbi:MAG: hypothetical protein SXU28_08155 [Pseudomonadota bacterium]|nr:hypothetical protein [Pseudomonadota bacterium]